MAKKVTVFGSARPTENDDGYLQAYHLGTLLARSGFEVSTGGYQGTMEAVSRGAAETGAHVIGVTCEEIEKWRNTHANSWVVEEIKLSTIQDRMIKLMDVCDAAIALPGGVGTLAEITLLWNRMVIAAIKPVPLVLIGERWRTFFDLFKDHADLMSDREIQLLTFAGTVEESVEYLIEYFKISDNTGRN